MRRGNQDRRVTVELACPKCDRRILRWLLLPGFTQMGPTVAVDVTARSHIRGARQHSGQQRYVVWCPKHQQPRVLTGPTIIRAFVSGLADGRDRVYLDEL